MSPQVETDATPGMANLVSGIINDAQELIRQQLTLFQVELKSDLRRTKEATIPLIVGMVVSLIGAILLSIMAAEFLHWNWPNLPLWGGYAIVGGIIFVLGVVLVVWGKLKFDAFNPLPDKSVEALKENVQWKTKT